MYAAQKQRWQLIPIADEESVMHQVTAPTATALQIKIVDLRFEPSTASTSAIEMSMASSGSGWPPAPPARILPPALCTRMSMCPKCLTVSSTMRATSSGIVKSPMTRSVSTPCLVPISAAVWVSVVLAVVSVAVHQDRSHPKPKQRQDQRNQREQMLPRNCCDRATTPSNYTQR